MTNPLINASEITPELRAILDEQGIGDLDPVTGPVNNPNFIDDTWKVSLFLNHANAYENPWVDEPFVPAKYADPRLDPDDPAYQPPDQRR